MITRLAFRQLAVRLLCCALLEGALSDSGRRGHAGRNNGGRRAFQDRDVAAVAVVAVTVGQRQIWSSLLRRQRLVTSVCLRRVAAGAALVVAVSVVSAVVAGVVRSAIVSALLAMTLT